jgi:hypothetical protein
MFGEKATFESLQQQRQMEWSALLVAHMFLPKFSLGSAVAWFFDVLLTLGLSCLCAHSLPLRSIVSSKYDPDMPREQDWRRELHWQRI